MKPLKRTYMGAGLLVFLGLALVMACSEGEDRTAKAEEYYQTGLQALEQDKPKEALIHFKNAVQQDPFHAEAHLELALLYLKDNQPRMALQELRTAVEIDRQFVKAKRILATLYYAGGAFSDAVPLCEGLIEQGEGTPDVFLILGNSLVRLDRITDAIDILTTAEELFPDNPDIKVSLAGAFFRAERIHKAREYMEAAAAASPENLSLQLLLAGFYQRIRMDEQVEQVLNRLMKEFPDQIAVHLASARFLFQRGRFQEAEDTLTNVKEQGLTHPDLFQLQGLLAHRRGETQEALSRFQEAVDQYPEDQRSLMLLADYHVFLKDFEKARETYEKIAAQWPGLSPVKAKIGELLLAERRLGEAEKHVEELLQEDPEYARGYVLKGLLDMEKGFARKAREEFSRAIDLDPRSMEGQFYYGLTFLEEQDYKVSLSVMLKALEENPDSVRVRFTMAYIYYKTGELSSALEELNRILAAVPNDVKARELRATVFVDKKDWGRAAKDFEAVLVQKPDAWPIRFQLARVYLAAGDLDQALKGFEQTLDSHTDPFLPIEGMVQVHLRKKNFDQALALCDGQLERQPGDLRLSLLKAGVLAAKGDEEAAKGLLTKVRAEHPASDRPLLLLARMALDQNDTADAKELYREAIDLNLEGVEAYMGLARIYIAAQEFDEAVDTYERMLEETGGHGPAENDLAYLYATLNRNLDRALELARGAREKLPGHPEVSDTLGWVHLQRGSLPLAEQHLSEAIAADPENPLYHFHLGVALARQERRDEAMEALNRAMSLNLQEPERTRASELKEQIREKQRLFAQ